MADVDTDAITLDDIVEKLGHLNDSAKRTHGTPFHARWHERINDTLDLWELATEMELGE